MRSFKKTRQFWNRRRIFRGLSLLTLLLGLIGGIALGNTKTPRTPTTSHAAAAASKPTETSVQLKSPSQMVEAPTAATPARKGSHVRKDATCAPPVPMDAVGWDGKGADRGHRKHEGYDLLAPVATPIYAVRDGVVIQSGFNGPSAGTLMKIKHAGGLVTWYLHMVPYSWVPVGTQVKQGQVIALVGEEGYTEYLHLHFEVHRSSGRTKGTVLDPVKWLQDCGITYYRDPRHGGK